MFRRPGPRRGPSCHAGAHAPWPERLASPRIVQPPRRRGLPPRRAPAPARALARDHEAGDLGRSGTAGGDSMVTEKVTGPSPLHTLLAHQPPQVLDGVAPPGVVPGGGEHSTHTRALPSPHWWTRRRAPRKRASSFADARFSARRSSAAVAAVPTRREEGSPSSRSQSPGAGPELLGGRACAFRVAIGGAPASASTTGAGAPSLTECKLARAAGRERGAALTFTSASLRAARLHVRGAVNSVRPSARRDPCARGCAVARKGIHRPLRAVEQHWTRSTAG